MTLAPQGQNMTRRPPGRAPTVLVVDDQPPIVELLRDLLEDEGLVVLTAPDGLAALAVATATPPDLILTDLMMPRLDGRALRARLQEQPRTAQIPVLLMSAAGQARPGDGFAAFIVKPFSVDVLLAAIHRHLPATL